jgi:hypothetical protein
MSNRCPGQWGEVVLSQLQIFQATLQGDTVKRQLWLLVLGLLASAPSFAAITVVFTRKSDTLATMTVSGTRWSNAGTNMTVRTGVFTPTANTVTITASNNTLSENFFAGPTPANTLGNIRFNFNGTAGDVWSGSVDLTISGSTWAADGATGLLTSDGTTTWSYERGTWSMGAVGGGSAAPVPEPEEYLLMAVGLGMLAWQWRRRAMLPAQAALRAA